MTTHMLLCAVLLVLTPTDPAVTRTAEEASLAEAGEASVVKVYDLAGLTQGPVENQSALDMFPFRLGEGQNLEFESEDIGLGDAIESLVYEVVAPEEFMYEGRSFRRMGDQLVVVAPPALQDRIAKLLDGFRAGFGRTAKIALDIYEVNKRHALPEEIHAAQIGDLVDSGVLRLVHARQEQVRVGYTERIEALNSTRIISHWDGEIAQNSAIAVPEIEGLETGVGLLVRVEDVPGTPSVRVRQALSVSELRNLGSRPTSGYSSVSVGDIRHVDDDKRLQDHPVVSTTVATGSSVLDVGGGMILLGQTSTLAGAAGWLAHLRVLQVDPAPAPMVFGENAIVVLDASAATWPAFELPGLTALDLASQPRHADFFSILDYGAKPPVFPATDKNDWLDIFMDCAAGSPASETDSLMDPWWWTQTPWVVWAGPTSQIDQSMALLPVIAGNRRNLVIELGVSERSGSDGAAREVARGRLPLESGLTGFLLFGDLMALPDGYEVDVAQSAAIVQPLSNVVFDGLSVEAAADGAGQTVQLRVASAHLLGLHDASATPMVPGVFRRPSFSLADARVRVPVDGKRRVVAELDGSVDGSGSRTLWVAVHAR